MLAKTRVTFANFIAKECNKNPEAFNSFICAVAETVNIADLQTISIVFNQALEINKEQKEQNQRN